MPLDIDLKIDGECVYDCNITHNLNKMAMACGLYYILWRPEEVNATKVKHILPVLRLGIQVLKADKEFFKKFEASNGWGTYEHFIVWLENLKEACEKFPEADIEVSR